MEEEGVEMVIAEAGLEKGVASEVVAATGLREEKTGVEDKVMVVRGVRWLGWWGWDGGDGRGGGGGSGGDGERFGAVAFFFI
jgi:hypothetical protein